MREFCALWLNEKGMLELGYQILTILNELLDLYTRHQWSPTSQKEKKLDIICLQKKEHPPPMILLRGSNLSLTKPRSSQQSSGNMEDKGNMWRCPNTAQLAKPRLWTLYGANRDHQQIKGQSKGKNGEENHYIKRPTKHIQFLKLGRLNYRDKMIKTCKETLTGMS